MIKKQIQSYLIPESGNFLFRLWNKQQTDFDNMSIGIRIVRFNWYGKINQLGLA